MEIDIVVPVWNRPMETRSCLIDLIEHSPRARFILVNNGSDRETERLLQDFAETLDLRALLLSTQSNRGIIQAINTGLERAEAPLTALVRNTCRLPPGWLSPLIELASRRPEAGLLTPPVSHISSGKVPKHSASWTRETTMGSLYAMVVRKTLFNAIGGLDEELDAGFWCERDYSRRAYQAGYLTLAVDSPPVSCRKEVLLGSPARREETVRRSAALFHERWGTEHHYCIWFPKGTDAVAIHERWDTLLKGARQGHHVSLLVPHSLYRELVEYGYDRTHENIVIPPPPRFFAENAAVKAFASLRQAQPEAAAVAGIDGVPFPSAAQSLPFSTLEKSIRDAERERYGH